MSALHRAVAVALITSVLGCTSEADAPRAVGQLESDRVELIAEFAEPIVERPLAEGRPVAAGDTLLRLSAARIEARIEELEAAADQHRLRLAELTRGPRQEQITAQRALVAGARQELEFRRTEFARAQDVHDRKLGSPESLDRARAAVDAATSAVDLHEARLEELLAGTTVEELRQAESVLRQAAARLTASRIDLERHTLRAPVDGLIDSLPFEVGETPARGMPTVIMLTGPQPYARVYVPEALRARIGTGTKARVFVDGLPAPFPGNVRWVASNAAFTPYFALTERDRGRLSYVAKVDIDSTEPRLPDGVPVEVEFELN